MLGGTGFLLDLTGGGFSGAVQSGRVWVQEAESEGRDELADETLTGDHTRHGAKETAVPLSHGAWRAAGSAESISVVPRAAADGRRAVQLTHGRRSKAPRSRESGAMPTVRKAGRVTAIAVHRHCHLGQGAALVKVSDPPGQRPSKASLPLGSTKMMNCASSA